MMRLFLIIIMATQLGCAVVLEGAAGSFIGGLAADLVKDKLDKNATDNPTDDKEPKP